VESHLITLFVRLGVMAALASFLVRSLRIRKLLMLESRTLAQRFQLATWVSAVFAAGVALRLSQRSYEAADLGFEASLLTGLVGGYVSGLTAGLLISVPAMFAGEYLALPLFALIGVAGGLLRDCATEKEDIWRFSPLFDLYLYRAIWRRRLDARPVYHVLLLAAILLAEFVRESLVSVFPHRVFALQSSDLGLSPRLSVIAIYASTFFCIAVPLKVWSNARNEAKLEEQARLLMQARLEVLTSQINPHFLFNTLNSVSSLIRRDPQKARDMILKLSSVLRRILRKQDSFTPLRDELEFVEDYLAIELVRFGDKLRVERDIAPDTLDLLVPSMLMQPIVENSVKHGLSSKVDGGTIFLRAHREGGRLHLEVEDNGVGIPEARLATMLSGGIGFRNVNERLKVLYASGYRMWIDSKPGRGTLISIDLPEAAGQRDAIPYLQGDHHVGPEQVRTPRL
jgi:two-component system LytT family sensor kinase